MRQFLVATAAVILCVSTAHAQCFFGCGDPVDITGDEVTLSTADAAAENSLADIDNQAQTIASIEQQNILPGLAGGFNSAQTLQGDLEQQVSSAGGMPLDTTAIAAYPTYWPGYSKASYLQGQPPAGSPEANMATTLGTLQGALNAGADQQQSQQAEAARMQELESANGNASGNLQALEVGNEIGLFNGQEAIKSRNSVNAQLNALLVAESNRQNQVAQDQLEGLGIATENAQWDATNQPPGPDPEIPDPGVTE